MAFNADKRELILERILAVGKTLVGEKNAFRNRLDLPDGMLPAFIVIDADEAPVEPIATGRRGAGAPVIVGMTPEIYLLMQAEDKDVGTKLNALRQKVIKAMMTDETLVDLCHNGDIRFEGFSTGLSAGRDMSADSGVAFTFVYALFPSRL